MSLSHRYSALPLVLAGVRHRHATPRHGLGTMDRRDVARDEGGWARLRLRLTTIGPGLVGQAMALAAMLVPVLARRTDQVQLIVFSSSAAILLLGPATLGIQLTLPTLRGRSTLTVALACSVLTLTGVSLALVAALLIVPAEHHELVLWSAVLLWTQGWYVITTTLLIRGGDAARIARMRLHYGLVLLGSTCVAVLLPGGYPLVVATVLSYVVTVAAHLRPALPHAWRGFGSLRRSSRLFPAYLRHAMAPTMSELSTGVVGPLAGVAVVGTGAFGAPWAVVNRIAGGCVTLLQQVLMPPIEVDLSRAARTRDGQGFARSSRRAALLGSAVAVAGCVGSIALAVYASPRALTLSEWGLMAAITVLFWGPTLVATPLNRALNFLGHRRLKLYLDLLRAAGLVLAFVLISGPGKLVGMAVVAALSSGAILLATRHHIRRYRSVRTRSSA